MTSLMLTVQPPLLRLRPVTRLQYLTWASGALVRCLSNWLVRAPKLTSVPLITRVAARVSPGSRPGIINGIHSAIVALSSVYSMSAKAWCLCSTLKRSLRKDTPLSPCTKLRCGTGLINDLHEPNVPFLVRYDQNCFDTSNWVLMCTAFLMSTVPSAACGV
ncbi:hypothetical protein D9M73_164480 [compost metagenome]